MHKRTVRSKVVSHYWNFRKGSDFSRLVGLLVVKVWGLNTALKLNLNCFRKCSRVNGFRDKHFRAVKHIQVKFAALIIAVDRLLKSDTVQEFSTKQTALPVLPAALPFAVFEFLALKGCDDHRTFAALELLCLALVPLGSSVLVNEARICNVSHLQPRDRLQFKATAIPDENIVTQVLVLLCNASEAMLLTLLPCRSCGKTLCSCYCIPKSPPKNFSAVSRLKGEAL